jgi:aryl-alcohol dehydrogenase-like predicted oxidoreductase
MQLVTRSEEIASAKGETSAQLVLAWLHAQSGRMKAKTVPILGTRKRS